MARPVALMTAEHDLFEIMSTTRAMRRLKPDPVPDELVRRILEAATWAPSAANRQSWRFLVVRDADVKARVQTYYKRAHDEYVAPLYAPAPPPPASDAERIPPQRAPVPGL